MTNAIGYTLGDEYEKVTDFSRPMPVAALSPEQQSLKTRIVEARRAHEEAQEALEHTLRECKHPVFTDHDGFIYTTRRCVICGTHIDDI